MGYLKLQHFENRIPDNARITRLSGNAVEYRTPEEKGIVYEYTTVAKRDSETGEIKLNTNGWETMTSKKWINHFINQYNYHLYQKDYQRYIKDYDGKTIEYKDNIILI